MLTSDYLFLFLKIVRPQVLQNIEGGKFVKGFVKERKGVVGVEGMRVISTRVRER